MYITIKKMNGRYNSCDRINIELNFAQDDNTIKPHSSCSDINLHVVVLIKIADMKIAVYISSMMRNNNECKTIFFFKRRKYYN